jgi:hypothetical protein
MAYTRLLLSCALVIGAVTTAVGCSAPASDDPASASDDALTSVTDLTEMEAAFGFYKDEKDPLSGTWNRSDAKLQNGPCYKKLIESPTGSLYEMRRYTSGAAFFKKQGAGFASGTERPVLCVDVDVVYDDGKTEDTLAVSDIEIDAVLRYRLGAPTGGDAAAGTYYDGFRFGYVSYHGGYCPENGFDPTDPDALATYCFGAIDFPGNQQADGGLQLMIYQYAWKHAVAQNSFSTKNDPVGRFVSMEGTWEHQTLKFENATATADVSSDAGTQTFSIFPNAPNLPRATCTRKSTENETWNVTCSGM